MEKVKLVVFDMAGTTIRDGGRVGDAFVEAFQKFNLEISIEEVTKVRGYRKLDSIRILLEKFYPEKMLEDEELISQIHQAFEKSTIDFYMSDPDLTPESNDEKFFFLL